MWNLRRVAGLLAFVVLLVVAAVFAMTALRVSFTGTEAEMAAARSAADAAGVPMESWKTLVVVASGSVGAPVEKVWERLLADRGVAALVDAAPSGGALDR